MYSVYILESQAKQGTSYVGLTIKSPKARLTEHNLGKSTYTKSFTPWKLVYFEQFHCKLCASKRERFLKSGKGFRLRQLIIKNQNQL